MAIRYVEYVKKIRGEDGELNPDNRDRHISEMQRSEGRTFKVDYHFVKRPDLGDEYSTRRICEVENSQHALSMVNQKSEGVPVFEYCEDYETEQAAKPLRSVFENNPELIQDYVLPVVTFFIKDMFVSKKDFDKAIKEVSAKLSKKANAAPGRKPKEK